MGKGLSVVKAGVAVVTPSYWDEACKHLSRRDRVMKKLIPQFGEARLQSRGDAFTTLARSIVGQQISVKAAQAVWDRFYSFRRIWARSRCTPSLRARLAFVLISKLYRQMYANTGIATDSARVARSVRRARWLAKLAKKDPFAPTAVGPL